MAHKKNILKGVSQEIRAKIKQKNDTYDRIGYRMGELLNNNVCECCAYALPDTVIDGKNTGPWCNKHRIEIMLCATCNDNSYIVTLKADGKLLTKEEWLKKYPSGTALWYEQNKENILC